jgi:hypothetical protein
MSGKSVGMVNLFSSNVGSNDFFNYFFLATRLQKAQALSGDFKDYFILPTYTHARNSQLSFIELAH